MALNRDKFRKIVGGITTTKVADETSVEEPSLPKAESGSTKPIHPPEGQGPRPADYNGDNDHEGAGEIRRFAKRGRPKGRKDTPAAVKTHKVKVSLFLDEKLINDLYDWAHADKVHPGEMFERALKPFHERELKRRNAEKG